jgi:hypothetical protein
LIGITLNKKTKLPRWLMLSSMLDGMRKIMQVARAGLR